MIAVFGANALGEDESSAAQLLGSAVNRTGAVLLSGGTGPDDIGVKGEAIAGAENGASAGQPATWIGVANRSAAAAARWRGDQSVVLTPGWTHRRNFVEACLCDAAIALGATSLGTASEALFSLFLGRPVVVLGDVSGESVDTRSLQELAEGRIEKPTAPDLAVDRGIAGAYGWAQQTSIRLEVEPLPRDAAQAASVVSELLGRIAQRSPRPDFNRVRTESDWDEYVAQCLRKAGR